MNSIFLYYNSSDFYTKDMLEGALMLSKFKDDVAFVTDQKQINRCTKVVLLLSDKTEISEVKIFLKKCGEGLEILAVNIHKDKKLLTENYLAGYKFIDWSLDEILKFCAIG